jgi:hypothetical protein
MYKLPAQRRIKLFINASVLPLLSFFVAYLPPRFHVMIDDERKISRAEEDNIFSSTRPSSLFYHFSSHICRRAFARDD